jgi:hypothetical protein
VIIREPVGDAPGVSTTDSLMITEKGVALFRVAM